MDHTSFSSVIIHPIPGESNSEGVMLRGCPARFVEIRTLPGGCVCCKPFIDNAPTRASIFDLPFKGVGQARTAAISFLLGAH